MSNNNDMTLIILRGSPAVGKTSISKKILSLNHNPKIAYIPIDEIQDFDKSKAINRKEELGIQHAGLLARNFLKNGYSVLIEYSFNTATQERELLDFILNENYESSILTKLFYLDATYAEIVKRNANRDGGPMKSTLLKKLYERLSETRGKLEGEVILDTTKHSAKQCAKIILGIE